MYLRSSFMAGFVVLVVSLITGCGGGGGGGGNGGGDSTPRLTQASYLDVFPVDTYYQWFYNDSTDPVQFTDTLKIGNRQVYALNHITGAKEYFFTTATDLNYYGTYIPSAIVQTAQGSQSYTVDIRFADPITLYSSADLSGGSRSIYGEGTATINPTYGTLPISYSGYVGNYGLENVTTPMGTYQAHRVEFHFSVDLDVSGQYISIPYNTVLWLVEDIGVVQRSESGILFQLTGFDGASTPVSFDYSLGSPDSPEPQVLDVFGGNLDAADFHADIAYQDAHTGWLSVSFNSSNNTAILNIIQDDLPVGTYAAHVKLISRTGTVIPLSVTFEVATASLTAPDSVTYSIDLSTDSDGLNQEVDLQHSGEHLDWNITSSVPWLTATQLSNDAVAGAKAMIAIDPAAIETLSNGHYDQVLTLTYSGQQTATTQVEIPVSIDVEFPEIIYPLPYVLRAGEAHSITLNGHAMTTLTAGNLTLGGVAVTDVQVVDSEQASVTFPDLPAGEYEFRASGALGVGRTAGRVVVKPALNLVETVVSIPGYVESIVFDEEREAFFGVFSDADYSTPHVVARIQYQSGTWVTDTIAVDEPLALTMTPDGKTLLVTTDACSVKHVDPDSLAVSQPTATTNCYPGHYDLVAAFNNGVTFVGSTSQWPSVSTYPDFAYASFPSAYSADYLVTTQRNMMILAESTAISAPNEVYVYYPKTNSFAEIAGFDGADFLGGLSSLSADGSRLMLSEKVYDADQVYIGSLEPSISDYAFTRPTPDGRYALRFEWQAGTVSVFDISAAAGPYSTVVDTIALPANTLSNIEQILFSQQGRTAFIFGNDNDGNYYEPSNHNMVIRHVSFTD